MVLVIFLLFFGFLHGKLQTRDCFTLHSLCIIESKKKNERLICVRGHVHSPPSLYFFSIKIVQVKKLSTLYIFRTLYNFILSSLYISRTLYTFEKCTEFNKCTELRVSQFRRVRSLNYSQPLNWASLYRAIIFDPIDAWLRGWLYWF